MKRSRSANKGKQTEMRLDLGLSSILSSFEASQFPPLESSSAQSPAANPIPASSSSSDSSEPNFILVGGPSVIAPPAEQTKPEPPKLNEYETLAHDDRWGELSVLCESRLEETGGSSGDLKKYEARLWWIRSQLVCGGVPSSILAAPLDSVSEGLLAARRSDSGQDGERGKLYQLCAGLLQEVGDLLFENSESALGISFLERAYRLGAKNGGKLLAEVDREISRIADDPRKSRNPKLIERKTKLESLRKELKAERIEAAEPVKEASVAPESREAASKKFEFSIPTLPRHAAFGLASLGILVVLAFALPAAKGALFDSPEPLTASARIEVAHRPEVLLPEFQRVAGFSSLDALFYDIDASRARADTQRAVSQTSPSPAAGASETAARSPAPAAAGARQKAVVDTTGPLEGPEFARIRAQEETRSTRRSDELFGTGGRVLGPSPVQGLEVEKFDADRLYIVITRTSVMARPSFQTAALAELQSGDRVLVEAKVGPWLKLRSKQGQTGYILSQDAELGKSSR